MALLNLGDLERERRPLRRGARVVRARGRAAAARPPADAAAWYEQLVASPRAECAALASYMCALLQMQLGDYEAARAWRRFGCRYRVAPAVWKLVGADAAPPAAPDRDGVQRWEAPSHPRFSAAARRLRHRQPVLGADRLLGARLLSFWEATAAPLIDVYVREVLLPLVARRRGGGRRVVGAHARVAPLDWPPDAF